MIYVLAFAIFLWIAGYITTAGNLLKTGVYSDEEIKIITPPRWVYYVCGAPVSKVHPKGALSVIALRTQMAGVFLGLFVICSEIIRPPLYVIGIGLGVSMLSSYLVTAYVSKRYASKDQGRVRKGRK
jgi:hypothetical protein